MKYAFLLLTLLLIAPSSAQQRATLITISYNNQENWHAILKAGFDPIEGTLYPKHGLFTTWATPDQLHTLDSLRLHYKILAYDESELYSSIPAPHALSEKPCPPKLYAHYPVPTHFEFGSIRGFYSYDEMLQQFQRMHQLYPQFIAPLQPIDTFRTEENRPILWTKLTAPNNKPDKPKVLFTALHHAREPGSLTQLIFFIWYLLEHYPSDPMVKTILDNVELHFIPCVNPDGYVYNTSIKGYWRKNRRRLGDSIVGVDLNRNYGFKWGIDDSGSSPDPSKQTYRGPAPFSEPETRAVAHLCTKYQYKAALNAHTYSALLLYPWAHTYELTPDSVPFALLGETMTYENEYRHGTSRLLYLANGTASDWMYGDSVKPPIYAFVPEMGYYGFWPPKDQIIPDCKAMLWTNMAAALSPLPLAHVQWQTPPAIDSMPATLSFSLINAGLQSGNFHIEWTASVDNSILFTHTTSLQLNAHTDTVFHLPIDFHSPELRGKHLLFTVYIDNGYYTRQFTFKTLLLYDLTPIFVEHFNDLSRWSTYSTTQTIWGLDNSDFRSPPFSLAESPKTTYAPNTNSAITLDLYQIQVPPNSERIFLSYWIKTELHEYAFDYVYPVILTFDDASTDFCPLVAKKHPYDSLLPHLYTGISNQWEREIIDITDIVKDHTTFQISFAFHSSPHSYQLDGVYIDDLVVYAVPQGPSHTTTKTEWPISLQYDGTYLHLDNLPPKASTTIALYSALGTEIIRRSGQHPPILNVQHLPNGMYWLCIFDHAHHRIARIPWIKQ